MIPMNEQQVQRLVDWAAQECSWQMTEPLKVGYLVRAHFTLTFASDFDLALIRQLGHEVEPELNPPDNWRWTNVLVGRHLMPPWQEVPRLMEAWFEAVRESRLDSTEAFREFEEIHPFVDGNGRVGALIFNYLNGSLTEPVFPPNLWEDSRREGVL